MARCAIESAVSFAGGWKKDRLNETVQGVSGPDAIHIVYSGRCETNGCPTSALVSLLVTDEKISRGPRVTILKSSPLCLKSGKLLAELSAQGIPVEIVNNLNDSGLYKKGQS